MGDMSVADAKIEIRAILNEPSPVFWSDAELENWLEQATIDISSKTLCLETSDTVTLVSGQLEYTEPTGCIKVYAAHFDDTGLLKIHPRQIAHTTEVETGAPQYYYHFAGKVGLYPICDAGHAGEDVTVFFSKESSTFTDLPNEYQPYAILFAVARAKLKDLKFAQSAQIMGQYLNALLFHRQDLYERGVDSKDMLKIPDRTVAAGQ